jgi:hypothetical protein
LFLQDIGSRTAFLNIEPRDTSSRYCSLYVLISPVVKAACFAALPQFEIGCGNPPQAEQIWLNCVPATMAGAERFRERAAHLRRLASTERDISVRQQLAAMAIRFDEFADELERLERAESGQKV